MSWLRIDDGFDTHPKIIGLKTDERRWTWQRILIYTCRYRSPIVPDNARDVVPKATPAFLRDCVKLGLIDVDKDGVMRVHDWQLYNGDTVAERVAAYLEKNPEATANQVHKAIGGKREVVLAVYAQLSDGGSQVVPERYPDGSPGGSPEGGQTVPDQSTPLVPLVRARGPGPDPGTEEQDPEAVTGTSNAADDDEPRITPGSNGLGEVKKLEGKVADSLRSP